MNRLGLMHPSTLAGRYATEARALYEAFSRDSAGEHDAYFTTKLPSTGALIGPWGVMLHTPTIGRAYLDLSNAVRHSGELSGKLSEICSLAVCRQEGVQYAVYSHRLLALKEGLTELQIQAVLNGGCPLNVAAPERVVYFVSRELCANSGSLTQRTWDIAIETLGREAARTLVHLVALFRYEATIMRGFDVQVPPERDRIEAIR